MLFLFLWIGSLLLFFLSVPSGTPEEAVARFVVGLLYSLSVAWFVTIILIIPDTRRLVYYGVIIGLITGFCSLLVATLANTSLTPKLALNREQFSSWQGYILLLMPLVLAVAAWFPLLRERLVIEIIPTEGATQDAFLLNYRGSPRLARVIYLRIHPNIGLPPIILYKEQFSPLYRQLDADNLITNPIAVNDHFVVAIARSPDSFGWMQGKAFSVTPHPNTFEVRLSLTGTSITLDNVQGLSEDFVDGLKWILDRFSQGPRITDHIKSAIHEEYSRLIPKDDGILEDLKEHMRLVNAEYQRVITSSNIDFSAPHYSDRVKAVQDLEARYSETTNNLQGRLQVLGRARTAAFNKFDEERFFLSLYPDVS